MHVSMWDKRGGRLPSQVDILVNYAKSFIGLPYIWGGNNPIDGFDCSGFVLECLKAVGVLRGGDRASMSIHNELKEIGLASGIEKGAILFFGKDENSITHTAIAISEHLMIEAGGGNSTTKTPEDAAKKNAFVRIRPIDSRSDLVNSFIWGV